MDALTAMKQALDALWDCTVKLESQQFRNPILIPPVYSDIIQKGYSAHATLRAFIETEELEKPMAWMFQHDETGQTMCVDAWQVENGFEENNPRMKKIYPLYAFATS